MTNPIDELIDIAFHARVPGGSEVWHWLPQQDAWTPHETARVLMGTALTAALTSLQERNRKLEEALRESRDVLGAIPAPHSYPLWERMCRAIRKAEIVLGGEA